MDPHSLTVMVKILSSNLNSCKYVKVTLKIISIKLRRQWTLKVLRFRRYLNPRLSSVYSDDLKPQAR